MPTIPQAQSAVVPMPEMPPSLAGAPYQAIQKGAEETTATAEYGSKVFALIQKAEDHTAYLKAENLINGDIEKSFESFNQRMDHDNFSKDAEDIGNNLKQHYESIYGNNPNVWQHVERALDSKINVFKHAVEANRLKLLNADENQQLRMSGEDLAEKYIHANTPEQKEMINNEWELKVRDSVNNQLTSPLDGIKLIKDFPRKCEEAELMTANKSNDPLLISRTLGKLESGGFKLVDITKRDSYQAMLQAKLEKKKTDFTVNAAVSDARANFMVGNYINYDAALKKYETDEEYQSELGLTDINGNLDRKKLEEGRKVLKELQIDQDNQLTGKLLLASHSAWDNHKEVNARDIKATDEFHGLSDTGKEKILDKIDSENHKIWTEKKADIREQRAEQRERTRESHDHYNRLTNDAERMADMTEAEVNREEVNLDSKDFKLFKREWQKMQSNWRRDPLFKQATDVINDAYKQGYIDAPTKEKNILELHQKQLEDNMTGDELIDTASKMVHPHVEHWYTGLLDKTMDKIKGKESKPNSVPMKSKSGKDMWMWSDGKYHYSQEK